MIVRGELPIVDEQEGRGQQVRLHDERTICHCAEYKYCVRLVIKEVYWWAST